MQKVCTPPLVCQGFLAYLVTYLLAAFFETFYQKHNTITMPTRSELSPQMRARICELHSIRWGAKAIHSKYPEISLSTIKSVIRRQTSDFKSRPRSGRPRVLSEQERDHVYDIVTHVNPHIKMRDLLREVDNKVKKRSL